MMTVRRAQERGHADHGWLDSHHTFSFADYYDPAHMGFRALRVINEDRVAPGRGFGTHPHRDMEIISYVLEGGLEHKDSLGTGSVIRPLEVQRMSAGTGVSHSELNASKSEPVHFLQIWLQPSQRGLKPSYDQRALDAGQLDGQLRLVASPEAEAGALKVHSDARLYAGRFASGQSATHPLGEGRHAWVQVARGRVRVNGSDLEQGDGVAISEEPSVTIEGLDGAEVLLFDLG